MSNFRIISPISDLLTQVSSLQTKNTDLTTQVYFNKWLTTTATRQDWRTVAYSPSLSKFCAVSAQSSITDTKKKVGVSSDGLNWTLYGTGGSAPDNIPDLTWLEVCWSPKLSIFCAIAYATSIGQTQLAMTSPDGITWTQRTTGFPIQYNSICWSEELSLFVAVGGYNYTTASNGFYSQYSSDGITWSSLYSLVSPTSGSSAVNKVIWVKELGLFISQGNNETMVSSNGTSWTYYGLPASSGVAGSGCIAWSKELGLLCCLGNSNGIVMLSSNGTTWTSYTCPSKSWVSLTWCAPLGLFVGIEYQNGASSSSSICYSTNGTSWTTVLNLPTASSYRNIYYFGNMFIAIGRNGAVGLSIIKLDYSTYATI